MHHAYIDEYSNTKSFIHCLEPRVKFVGFLLFILFIIFTRPESWVCFILYAALIGALILLSRLPPVFILKRSLVIIPFVLMISVFTPFIKEGEVAGAFSLGTLELTLTYDGLMIFWNVLIKAYLSILCMILLMATTGFSDLLKALEKLKLPQLIIMVLSFMYRYIFVIQDELMKMKQAKECRSAGRRRRLNFRANANMIAVLFIRAYERAESVYLAMCSRGYSGRINTINRFVIGRKDLIFLVMLFAILSAIRAAGS